MLKKLLPLVFLASCSVLGTRTFDPLEFDKWLQVSFAARGAAQFCGTADAPASIKFLSTHVQYATLYSTAKEKNPRIEATAQILQTLDKELNDRYTAGKVPSTEYCRLKLTEIESLSLKIAESLSKKET